MGLVEINGKVTSIMDDRDIIYAAEEHMGWEFAKVLSERLDRAGAEEIQAKERAKSDLESYEADLDHLHRMMVDLQEEIETWRGLIEGRINKDKLRKALKEWSDTLTANT